MLPLFEQFVLKHNVTKPIVVADSAMLSEQNVTQLEKKRFFYIVSARFANTSLKFIKQVSNALQQKDKSMIRLPSKHGDMICSFSKKRYRKQLREMNKQIEKAKKLIANNISGKRIKFVQSQSKKTPVLNKKLIDKTKLLLGIKGYCTNLPVNEFSNEKIIDRYHDLWRVEQAFRMSKSDLQARPVFHYKEYAIRSHVLICFAALMMEKYLELSTSLSLRNIRDLIWDVTEAHIQDMLTMNVFTFRSSTKGIMSSPLGKLVKVWGLPH